VINTTLNNISDIVAVIFIGWWNQSTLKKTKSILFIKEKEFYKEPQFRNFSYLDSDSLLTNLKVTMFLKT
jgi:hypothetical protein